MPDQTSAAWRSAWTLADDVVYLNHGSFGPSPRSVQDARERWSRRVDMQPMDFFLRQMEEELDASLACLGQFIGAPRECLTFVDNATSGMNIVAASVALQPDDEVLLTDHEYGAVTRLWRRTAQRAGAKVGTATLPLPLNDPDDVVAAILESVTERTRLAVVSHVTSPTAVILPVENICRELRARGISVCIDGPHAVAMLPLDLKRLDCDFYTASCHKWLSAPFGSGFLYVHPRQQGRIQPAIVSWGGSVSGRQPSWKDEFTWLGTRDPAAFLAVKDAVEFLRQPARTEFGERSASPTALDEFRMRARTLIALAREQICAVTGLEPLVTDLEQSCGTMIALPLPVIGDPPRPGQRDPLQDHLWARHRIEIPILHWQGRRFVRVSSHLYNSTEEIDVMANALKHALRDS